ncbi:MAG: GDSL-type esterase/lipase family protein [Bacteroidota bacterium]
MLFISLAVNLVLVAALGYLVHRLGGVKFMWHRIQSGGLAGIYENRNQLLHQLSIDKNSIVFLGDSLTEYGQWAELLRNNNVKNRGIAGDTTWGLLRRLQSITEAQPKAIFLMIGVNDFLFTDASEILENYGKIIEQIQAEAPNSQLFIQSLLPVNQQVKKSVFDNSSIVALNVDLEKLCQEKELPFINLHPLLLNDQNELKAAYTADGIHLNGNAYQIWKAAVQPIIGSLD